MSSRRPRVSLPEDEGKAHAVREMFDRIAGRYDTYLPPPPDLVERFRASGFADARITELSGGIALLLSGTRA